MGCCSGTTKKFQNSPKERSDECSSGSVIQRDGQLLLRLRDLCCDFLCTEERVEKDKPGNQTTSAAQPLFIKHGDFCSLQIQKLSYLAMLIIRSSCLFTWWLSTIETRRATIHFLKPKMEFSILRRKKNIDSEISIRRARR